MVANDSNGESGAPRRPEQDPSSPQEEEERQHHDAITSQGLSALQNALAEVAEQPPPEPDSAAADLAAARSDSRATDATEVIQDAIEEVLRNTSELPQVSADEPIPEINMLEAGRLEPTEQLEPAERLEPVSRGLKHLLEEMGGRLRTREWPALDRQEEEPSYQARIRIETYRQELDSVDPSTAARLLYEIARIYETELDDPRSALEAIRDAFSREPSSPAILNFALLMANRDLKHHMAADLLARAAEAAPTISSKARYLLDLAALQELRLGNEQQAAETYLHVLQTDPTNLAAAEALLHLYLRGGQWNRVADLCGELADAEEDPQSRFSLLLTAALLADEGDSSSRARLAAQALGEERGSQLALFLAIALFRKRGDWEEAIRLLEEQANARPEHAAALHFQISRMNAEHLGQMGEAIAFAERAVAIRPDDLVLLNWLIELYRREVRWSELVETLRSKVALITQDEERVEVHVATAEILEHRLHQPGEAIAELEAALRYAPTDLAALQGLGRLYTRSERWEDLVQMHLGEASASEDSERRASAMYRCSRIMADKLGQVEEAITFLEQALELNPTFGPALRLLEILYRKTQRYQDLITLYRQELEHTRQVDHRASLLERIATLLDIQLGDITQATAAYIELLDIQPNNISALQALVRLQESQQDVQALLSSMRALASLLQAPKQKAEVLVRMGQLIEEKLENRSMALAHYQEALDLDPSALDLYEQVGRLLYEEQRWEDLIRLYRMEIEVAEPEVQLRLYFSIGRLNEHQLDDPVAASEAYQQALAIDASYWPAIRGVLRMARQVEDFHKVVELETRLLDEKPPGPDSAATLIRVGLLLDEEANELEAAQRFFARAAKDNPDNDLAHMLHLRTLVEGEQWDRVVKRVPPLSGALLTVTRIHQPDQARQLLQRLLEQQPDAISPVRWLEALQAAAGDRRSQARTLELRALRESNAQRRVAARLRLGSLAMHCEDAVDVDPAANYRAILEDLPGDPFVLETLGRVVHQQGDGEQMLDVLQLLANADTTSTGRALARTSRAELLMQLGRQEEALQDWRQALSEDPHCRPAYEALKWHFSQRQDNEMLGWVLEQGLDAVHHPKTLVLDLLRRADLRLERGDWQGAVADLDRVLKVRPAQPNALDRIRSILHRQGEYMGLAQRLESAAKLATPPEHQAEIYLELGLLYSREIKDLDEAQRCLSCATCVDPDNVKALLAAADLNVQLDQPTEALALLNRVVLRATEEDDLITARLEIARICEDDLGDPLRARSSLETILEWNPKHREALRRMIPLATKLNDLNRLRLCLQQLAELEEDPRIRAAHLARLSGVLKQQMGHQSPEALIPLEKALELQPDKIEWLRELVDCYQATERWGDVERLLSSHLDLMDDEHKPGFLILRGRALGQHLGQHQEAITVLRQALRGDPKNTQAAELLLEQLDLDSITDPDTIAEAIKLHRFLLRDHPRLVDSLRALRTLCDRAGRIDESFCAESCLVLLGEANEEESYFFKQRKTRAPSRPSASLAVEQIHRVALPSGDHPIRRVLVSLRSHLNDLMAVDLCNYGLERLQMGTLPAQHRVREVAASCAQVFLHEGYELAEALGGTPCGATEPGVPPILLLPEDILRLPVPEQRFLLGRLLTRLAMGTESLDPGRSEPLEVRDLQRLLVALQRTEDATFGDDLASASVLDDLVDRLRGQVSNETLATARVAAREAWDAQHSGSLETWIHSTEIGACRGGLLCCGSTISAQSVLSRLGDGAQVEEARRDLIAFTTSTEYAALRQQLGLALGQ